METQHSVLTGAFTSKAHTRAASLTSLASSGTSSDWKVSGVEGINLICRISFARVVFLSYLYPNVVKLSYAILS
ncbi:MAG: hypothetical protein ACMUJM_18880 [bacterium]